MMKKSSGILILGILLMLPPALFAADAVKLNNAFCPVSGDRLEGMKSQTPYVHEGKEYRFCCKHCIKDFKKDPQKFILKMQEQEAKAAAETVILPAASESAETFLSSDGVDQEHSHEDMGTHDHAHELF